MSDVLTRDFVGVPDPALVFVIIGDREKFDRIAQAAHDHGVGERGGHVLSKSVESGGIMVVFQHWLKNPATPQRPTTGETGNP